MTFVTSGTKNAYCALCAFGQYAGFSQIRSHFPKLNPKDPKKFWKAITFLNKSKQSIPTLSLDGTVANSDVDKANLLNSFFCSCFNRSHPPIQHQPTPDIDSSTCPEELLCTDSEVCEMLAALNVTKSSGPDGISPRMLKALHPALLLLSPGCLICPFQLELFRHLGKNL